jgi:hypothetical protein
MTNFYIQVICYMLYSIQIVSRIRPKLRRKGDCENEGF